MVTDAMIVVRDEGTSHMAKASLQKGRGSKSRAMTVGRRGKIRFGNSDVRVVVVEDRGHIGSRGRQLVRVRLADNADDPERTFEVPADELVFSKGS
jgi:hypothetical protein